jgi:hypothetical protein
MDETTRTEELLAFFKALADATRLKIVGLLAQEPRTVEQLAALLSLQSYDRKVLRDFSGPDGRLKQLPLQRKKFEAILRHVVKPFECGVRYSEKRVNEILSQYHEDTAALRRGLVDTGMMARDHGVYWREE